MEQSRRKKNQENQDLEILKYLQLKKTFGNSEWKRLETAIKKKEKYVRQLEVEHGSN